MFFKLEVITVQLCRNRHSIKAGERGASGKQSADGTVARLGVMPRWLLADADRGRLGSAAPEAGAERAVVDGAADLEQPIGTAPRPAHLLRFVHATIDQEVGCSLSARLQRGEGADLTG